MTRIPRPSDDCSSSSRREFLSTSVVGLAGVTLAGALGNLASAETAPSALAGSSQDWSKVHGFNYQPSYGTSGLELWQKFDAATIAIELDRGKRYFPHMNALRWWQSWDAFSRDPERYARNFDTTLTLAQKRGCLVMPVLFNRWHDAPLDYGGIYIDHFLPDVSWIQNPSMSTMFDSYLERIVGKHKDDPRILAWDICNEPYSYNKSPDQFPQVADAETAWLQKIYKDCKALAGRTPITVGIWAGVEPERVNSISDVLSIHPYWIPQLHQPKADYEQGLDAYVSYARKVNKPLIATECCWGSLDDSVRTEIIRYTLTQLRSRGIGYLVYVLHHSLVADCHRAEFGPLGLSGAGNLSFIEADGSLRPGHGVFNDF